VGDFERAMYSAPFYGFEERKYDIKSIHEWGILIGQKDNNESILQCTRG
jgi:hypothetical protein